MHFLYIQVFGGTKKIKQSLCSIKAGLMQSENDFLCVSWQITKSIIVWAILRSIWIRYKIRSKVHCNQTGRTKNTQDTWDPWGPSEIIVHIWTLRI